MRAGHFESLEDLSDRVRGIGVKKLQAMQAGGLRVGGSTQSKTPDSDNAKLVFSSVHPVVTPAVMEVSETTDTKP
jgi:competence protein ComEA